MTAASEENLGHFHQELDNIKSQATILRCIHSYNNLNFENRQQSLVSNGVTALDNNINLIKSVIPYLLLSIMVLDSYSRNAAEQFPLCLNP